MSNRETIGGNFSPFLENSQSPGQTRRCICQSSTADRQLLTFNYLFVRN